MIMATSSINPLHSASSPEFFSFISKNSNQDPIKLRLSLYKKDSSIDMDFALTQIVCRQKSSRKLSKFIKNEKFLFPSTLSAEQATHQAVATFHSTLLGNQNGSLLDMTAGLGIDVLTMSDNTTEATAIELDPLKAEILKYNAALLGKTNLEVVNGDSAAWILGNDRIFDTIFIDPARRKEDNSRAYNFHDCLPDIVKLQDSLIYKTSRLLIKASPLLDISQTLKDIKNVTSIRVVCVQGECKEILIEASKPQDSLPSTPILYEAIDLNEDGKIISYFGYTREKKNYNITQEVKDELINKSYPLEADIKRGNYLYEPNAAVMKLAPWAELCVKFPKVKKLAQSSHLFISSELYPDFPGRILIIEKPIEKKDRKAIKGLPVNVVVRNYPLTVSELRKKLGVKEGTDLFLYGTTLSKPLLILSRKLSNLK